MQSGLTGTGFKMFFESHEAARSIHVSSIIFMCSVNKRFINYQFTSNVVRLMQLMKMSLKLLMVQFAE